MQTNHSEQNGYFIPVKEKYWEVKLVNGFIEDSHVRSTKCENCNSKSEVVVRNNADPDLALFGCNNRKCKHALIRMKINSEAESSP